MTLAYYVHDLSPFLFRFGNGFGIRWYGLAYILAFLFGTLLYRHLARKGYSDLTPDQVTDFITWGALFGVVLGGRLGYMLFYDVSRFAHDPLIFFRVWEGGMASHGGIIGLALFSLWYARRHHVSWLNLGDNLVVVAPIGLFLGRCANFINGELFGRATSSLWAMQFPKELLFLPPGFVVATLKDTSAINPKFCTVEAVVEGVHVSPALHDYLATILTPRYPSQLIEALLEGVLLFALLWMLRIRCRLPNGVLTGVFFIAYAIFRIAGEAFREPDAPMTGALTRGQFLSLFLIVIGLVFVAVAFCKQKYPMKWKNH